MKMTRSSATPLQLRQSAAYFLAFIALGLSFTALGPTLTDLAAQTSSNLGEFSFVFFASSCSGSDG